MLHAIRCLAIGLSLISGAALAMDIAVHGDKVIASGAIDAVDEPRLAVALAAPGVRELVLVNSTGGDSVAGLAMGRQVAAKRLRTTVIGSCGGACPLVFLGGGERRFAEGQHPRKTQLLLEGVRNRPIPSGLGDRILEWTRQRLGSAFDGDLMASVLTQSAEKSGSIRLREPERNTPAERMTQKCDANEPARCTQVAGKDAVSLGWITDPVTLKTHVSADLLPAETFFGMELRQPSTDIAQAMLREGQAMCGDDGICNERFAAAVPRFQVQKSLRAAALGNGRRGFGFSDDQISADQAAKRAIYLCNHTPGNKKFCSVVAVDQFDLTPAYEQNARQTEAAVASIQLPAGTAWADEDRGDAAPAPAALKQASSAQGPTPLVVAGIRTWRTPELAAAVRDRRTLTLVDVHGVAPRMLPGAVHFWDGGLALTEEPAEREYDQRFRDMLQVAQPAKDAPIVFYCQDASCWQAINAAVRASRAGYTQAGWYRGGLSSWTAAGLPLVQKVPRAVLY